MIQFSASLPFDRRLALYDIKGSITHVRMLARQGVLQGDEAAEIISGLEEIDLEIREETFPFDLSFEDIHMNIEKRLMEKIGPAGGRMHTGRSRNDQVALGMHLYLKEEIVLLEGLLVELQETLLGLGEKYLDVIIPGYTHLQRAQPLLLAHHLLAYFWMFYRDRQRLAGVRERTDLMPLGAGALAGSGFPLDRDFVAESLGFKSLYENSIDAVSDRDYVLEFLSFAAILAMHLSRFCEELVLWSSSEFAFIELDDAYTTGSSMMPQKKNPDVAELIRGKTGRIYGSLFSLLTMMKGLPLAYNKDMQEDKEGLFDTVDTLKAALPLFAGMLRTMTVNRVRLAEAVDDDYLCATDLADFLVLQGVPFREAHHRVGETIASCRHKGVRLRELTLAERRALHPALENEIAALFDPLKVVEARTSRGGTARAAVIQQLAYARQLIPGDGDGSA